MKVKIVLGLICISIFIGIIIAKEEVMAFELTSPAFKNGEEIPVKYTCQGEDISPPLKWSGVPEGTKSLALIVDDPDAPDPENPKMVWVHWVLYNIPPDIGQLEEGVGKDDLPPQVDHGLNDWKRTGYGGPCPPIGRHRYFFKLYALDTLIRGLKRPTKQELERAIRGHVLSKAELIGTYKKK